MKRLAVLMMILVLILMFSCPVFAINDQPKFNRENNLYASAEWISGEPYGEEPYSTLELEIGRNTREENQFILQLQTTIFDGTVYTLLFYNVLISESDFTIPQKLDDGLSMRLQTSGTQYGYSYEIDDEYNPFNESQWEEQTSYNLDLVWTRDNLTHEFINNHFALNWSENQGDLINLVFKEKSEYVTGSVSGTINQQETSPGSGVYGYVDRKIPVYYGSSKMSTAAENLISAKREHDSHYNDINDFSNLSGRFFIQDEADPDFGKSIYLSIGMHDKHMKTWALNISEDIFNDDNEVIGSWLFIANISDSAFAFPNNSSGEIVLDANVCGTVYDYIYGEDEPVITEFVEHDIFTAWSLMITQTSKAISKRSDDYSKSIDIQKIAYYEGLVNLELDGAEIGEGEASGNFWLNHSISKFEMP